LKYQFHNGETVEIITSSKHFPNRDWLKLAKTSRALAKIRQWIKTEEREKSLALGRDLCVREFKRHRLDFNDFIKTKGAEVAEALSFKTPEDMLIAAGYGKVAPSQIIRKLRAGEPEEQEPEEKKSRVKKFTEKAGQQGILIHGLDDILVHLGRCCTPIPGDEVVGYITRGRGVTIHRENCSNIRNLDPDRRIEVTWADVDKATYPAKIRVSTVDQKGMLAAVSNAISAGEANILEAKVTTTLDYVAVLDFVVDVKDRAQLRKILSSIRRLEGVKLVERISLG
jgi:guanosine-3',5'-bis(diphosphate) 3'-pyrophosphohydrolase